MARVPRGYRIGTSWRTKGRAKSVARGSRKRGFRARVVKASKKSRILGQQRRFGERPQRWLVVYKPKRGWGGRPRKKRR